MLILLRQWLPVEAILFLQEKNVNMENEIRKVLEELRKERQRKFDQTIEMVINLKKFDPKKESFNLHVLLPHKIRNKKICAFLMKKNTLLDTITKGEFEKYKNKKEVKKLVKNYDFFIAHASLMPFIATSFGKYLGPAGKMPSPQLGIVTQEDESSINTLIEKVNSTSRIKSKEPSLKIPAGKISMKDEEIIRNILQIYNAVLQALTKEKIKSVLLKSTMSKPIKLQI